MRVFVTGMTGFIGSAVVGELLRSGHQVLGLARSPGRATELIAHGAEIVNGSLDDLDVLRAAAAKADAVAHLAFDHDFSRFEENSVQDHRAITAMGAMLAGSDRPIVVTAGVGLLAPGRLATERDVPVFGSSYPRQSEAAAAALVKLGVRATLIRLAPTVHGMGERGFIPMLFALASEKGVSAYLGDGLNRWSAVHRLDAARLYRLALEAKVSGRVYHGVAEEGVAFRAIAQVIGRRLGVPVESRGPEHFGWLAGFAGEDMAASSKQTRDALGWHPSEPTLLLDIGQPGYFDGFPA